MEVFEQNTADNKYLHRDFHISMNMLMKYIVKRYGKSALSEYLKQFSREYHAGLKSRLNDEGLGALFEYFEKIYEKEEWKVEMELSGDSLVLRQTSCPGLTYIKRSGQEPAVDYIETYMTVYEEICEDTPYEYKMIEYNPETGACVQIFRKRGVS